MFYNKTILAGVIANPDIKYSKNGLAILTFGLGFKTDYSQPGLSFISCVVFGEKAETYKEYIQSKRSVLVEGRLKCDKFENKETFSLRVDIISFVDNVAKA